MTSHNPPKQTSRSCQRRWNHEKMAGDSTHGSTVLVCTHTSAPR